MAEGEIEVMLKWENGKSFEMTQKHAEATVITVVRMEENGNIKRLWEHVEAICKEDFARHLAEIGEQMKAP